MGCILDIWEVLSVAVRAKHAAGIDGFAAWAPHEHPELGTVEIGGFLPYAATNPPAKNNPATVRNERRGLYIV